MQILVTYRLSFVNLANKITHAGPSGCRLSRGSGGALERLNSYELPAETLADSPGEFA